MGTSHMVKRCTKFGVAPGCNRLVATVALVVPLVIALSAHAGTTWDGGGVNTNVTTAGNWNDDTAPPFSGGSATLTFATSGSAATLDQSLDIARLLFNASPTFSIGTSGDSTLTLQGEGVSGVNTGITAWLPWLVGSGTYTLSAPVILGADQSWNISNGSGTTTLLVSGPISGSGRALTKLGNGVLALAGANTYSGTTTVDGGTLELRTGASLAGPVAVNSIGTLRFGNGPATTLPFANGVSGAGSLAVAGGGAVQLTAANPSFTGATSVARGELAIASAAALGSGSSPIVVAGTPNAAGTGSIDSVTYAFSPAGGQLAIVSGGGLTLSRNLQLSGFGMRQRFTSAGTATSATLRSTGDNLLSGTVEFSNASLASSFGTLGISGAVTTAVATGTATISGNALISGPVSMPSGVLATGAGTLRLLNPSNSIGSISLGGSLEVATAAVLGGAPVTLGVGRLQIRTTAADAAGFGAANVTAIPSAVSNILFVNNARGGSDVNQTVPLRLGGINAQNQRGFYAAGGNGYGLSLTGTGGGTIFNTADRGIVFGNGSNGLLTIDADVSTAAGVYLTGVGFTTGANLASASGPGDIVFNGSFLIATSNTAMPFVMSNLGRVVMNGTQNQMTGSNAITNGTLQIRGLGALASGTINIGSTASAAALEYLGPAGTGAGETWSRPLNLAGTTGGAYLYASQAGTAPGPLVITGPITATGAGVKTVMLGGSSTEDNEIAAGIPENSATHITNLQKIGAGTWVLSGTNTFTGTTTISGGVLKLQAAAGRTLLPDARPLIFDRDAFTNSAAGRLEFLGENNAASTETTGTLTPTAGAGRIVASGSGTGSARLTLAALGTRTAGATVDFATAAGGTIGFAAAPTLANGILGPWATVAGANWATLSGSNVAPLASYTDLDAQGSTLADNAATNVRVNAAGSGGNISLGAATTSVNTLLQATTTAATVETAGQTLRAGGVMIAAGQGPLAIGAAAGDGTLTAAAAGGDLVLWNHSADPLTVNAAIANNTSAATLTKSGTGLLVLGGANTYTGNTTINEGTVRLSGASAALGGISVAGNRTTIRQAGTLDVNAAGASNAVTIGLLDGSGLVTNSGGGSGAAATLQLGQATTTTGIGYFTGIVQDGAGSLGLTKAGATSSVQYLTGLNTYTGPTTITSGTLAVTALANIGQASGIGAGDGSDDDTNAASLVFNGGVLQYTGANATVWQPTQTLSVSIDRLFTLAGNGTIDSTGMYGDNDFSGGGFQNAASLILSNTGRVRIDGAGGRTLTLTGAIQSDSRFNRSVNNQIALLLADGTNAGNTLSVTKAGNTLWKLTNPGNSYTGATTVSAGLLEIGDDSSASTRTLSQNSNLALSGGILVSSGTFARAAGTGANEVRLINGAASGFAAGPGDLVVSLGSGPLAWGSGNFNVGTLYLNGPSSLGTVTFASPIDLNNGSRTIHVLDNVDTTFDYAIVSGVISGSGGLTKTGAISTNTGPYGGGAPPLRLSGGNTYTGTTTVSVGSLVVETIGDTASTSSNLGAGSAVVALAGSTSLDYIGSGETSDRQIRNSAANQSFTITNNGGGPLVLTNLGLTATSGATTLTLGGGYAGANEVRNNLAGAGGTLNLTLAEGSTWILSGSNTFGTVTIGAGAILGIGSDTALNASGALSPGAAYSVPQIAAIGGARTIASPITLGAQNTIGFTGEHSITYSGSASITSNSRVFINNSIATGSLSITGPIANSTNPVNLKGPGQTILSGSLTGSGAVNYFNADASGSLTLSGNYAGNTTASVNNKGVGPIIFTSSNAIPKSGAILAGVAGSTLAAGYAIDQAFLGRISSTGSSFAVGLAADSANNLNFSGTATGGANLTAASLGAVGTTTRVYSGTLTPNGTAYRLGGGGGTLDFQSALTGVSNTLTVGGDVTGLGGTVILSSAANSYGGATTVQRGILQVASLANAGSNSSTGTNGTINLSSGTSTGTLRYVGLGDTSNRTINIQGTVGGTLDASGSGALDMTSGTISAAANTLVTLTGSSTAANSMGPIAGAGVSVDKTGPGLWRLTGNSSYTGRLTVRDGTAVVASAVGSGNSPFGGGTGESVRPIIGSSAAGLTGTVALLADDVEIARGFSVAALGAGSSQVAVIGNAGSGTATFAGTGGVSIRLARDVTLQAATGGEAVFSVDWQDADGGGSPAVAFTVGSAGNAGTVAFARDLPGSITAVNIVRGTARIQGGDDRILYTTPVTIGSAGGPAALDLGGRSQSLGSVAFTGTGSQVAAGTLRMFNGGSAAAVNVNGTGHAISSLVALDAATSFNVDAASRLLVSSAISEAGGARSLTKTGLGILELAGQNTYSGDTTVSAGTLVVNGSLANGALSVASNATLMGSGTIGGLATIFGTHSPGNSPGIETFSSNLTYTGGASQLVWELWGNTVSNSPLAYDQIIVNADLAFTGATSLSLDFGGSGVGTVDWDDAFWGTPQTWALFDVAGATSSFGNLSLTQSPSAWLDASGQAFSASSRSANSFSVAQQGNDVVVSYTVIVPEPGSLALAGLGFAAVAIVLRRRRS